jgi:hypothetical protein
LQKLGIVRETTGRARGRIFAYVRYLDALNDEIFVDFITGYHDAFVIEDADHMLMARANGNVDLHRFLAVFHGSCRPAIWQRWT